MSLAPAITDAVTRRDAARFCQAILPAVSRTFALGIKVLPGELGQAVLDAYLLCRIADTVEDAPDMLPERKAALFDDFLAAFDDRPRRSAASSRACSRCAATRRTSR